MALKKCLLVTDDPDDHIAFTDAITEHTRNAVVLVILDSQKALEFLIEKSLHPDYIFLDLSMHGIRINSFIKTLRADKAFAGIPTVLYGSQANFAGVDDTSDVIFFDKEYTYSALKEFLKGFL